MTQSAPGLDDIAVCRERIGDAVVRTPMTRCAGIEDLLGNGTTVSGKLEFLQRTGTFKARGALASVTSLSKAQLDNGITAVSAGNHAIAAAFAAQVVGTHAKIVMIGSANRYRVDLCRAYGAEIVMADDAHSAFEMVDEIQDREGRYLVHPFEGPHIAAGTGTVGVEICEQCDDFDAVVVAVGGGGLIGGISNAIKKSRPNADVIGVEVDGADSMHRSLAEGRPMGVDKVNTIADSLGAPFALPYSFSLCQQFVDRMAMVSDDDLRCSMALLFEHMKVAVEPACAAPFAALLGPLRDSLKGKHVVLVFCGSNIDWNTWWQQARFH